MAIKKKKAIKVLGKKFLNPLQIATLKDKKWKVKPNGFRNTFYQDDFDFEVWESMCVIAGVDPDLTNELTLISFGFIASED